MLERKLDRTNPLPLYCQLREIIVEMVHKGELKPGDAFWTEEELAEKYGTSRTTIREAIRTLAQDGYLVIQQGKRTSVTKPKVTRGFPGLTSFSEDMRKRGLVPGSWLLGFDLIVALPSVAEKLKLEDGQKVVQVKRQMLADNEPIGYHIVYLPHRVWEKLNIEPEYLNNRSLYKTLEEKGGFSLSEADESIEVGYADKETAKVLMIKKGAPILIMNRVVYTSEGVPIENAINIYRTDRYKYEIHHRRQKQG
jgi:GntR family transcriptional regulator